MDTHKKMRGWCVSLAPLTPYLPNRNRVNRKSTASRQGIRSRRGSLATVSRRAARAGKLIPVHEIGDDLHLEVLKNPDMANVEVCWRLFPKERTHAKKYFLGSDTLRSGPRHYSSKSTKPECSVAGTSRLDPG